MTRLSSVRLSSTILLLQRSLLCGTQAVVVAGGHGGRWQSAVKEGRNRQQLWRCALTFVLSACCLFPIVRRFSVVAVLSFIFLSRSLSPPLYLFPAVVPRFKTLSVSCKPLHPCSFGRRVRIVTKSCRRSSKSATTPTTKKHKRL